jgi:hypothetical protein
MANDLILDEETLEAAAWVCYVQSLDGRTILKVTDTPNWVSDFQKEKYVRRAREIFSAVNLCQRSVQHGSNETEHLITSADINTAGAGKAYELWGGGK